MQIRSYDDADERGWLRCRLLSFADTAYYCDDTIAVHPDFQRVGLGSRILHEAVRRLPSSVAAIDAWTRDDPQANTWYLACGFVEAYRYLHVYKSSDESSNGWNSPSGLGTPITAFTHAPIEMEAELRLRFRRTHVCRQYVRRLH